ncbi:MAG: hypothetical protein ACR2IT_09460 [Pirellulales bacterium]
MTPYERGWMEWLIQQRIATPADVDAARTRLGIEAIKELEERRRAKRLKKRRRKDD